MSNEIAEKMARDWAEDHYEHWEDIDPVEAAEDGYRAGFLAGQQSLWRKYPEEKPEKSGFYPIHWEDDDLLLSYWHNDLQEWDCEVTDWYFITLPKQEG